MMVRLPVPPSVNALFVNRKNNPVNPITGKRRFAGRMISREYEAWRQHAGLILNRHNVVPFGSVPVELGIFIPDKTKGDLSNRIKALEDLIVSHNVINDDRQVKKITIQYHPESDAVLSITQFLPSLEARQEAARRIA